MLSCFFCLLLEIGYHNVTMSWEQLLESFLNMTPKAQEIKARINKWDGFKLKSLFSANDTITNVKKGPTEH